MGTKKKGTPPTLSSSMDAALSSPLSQALREYREIHHLTQEELAFDLDVHPKTLGRYERGEGGQNIRDLRRIADFLGIAPERLGLSGMLDTPRSPTEIEAVTNRIWLLSEQGRFYEAKAVTDQLIEGIKAQLTSEDPFLLRSLAHAYHVGGYVVAMLSRSQSAYRAIPYYHQMEEIARILQDDTLINIALTYEGDMNQRIKNYPEAINYLEAAKDTKQADSAALGNGVQLLGRAYLRVKNMSGFERTMALSEELAFGLNPQESSTRGLYSLGTVYEEYGRSYADLGQMDKALEYLQKARVHLPKTPVWQLLVTTAEAIALVKGGEIRAGAEIAAKAAQECYATGNQRHLDRIYIVRQHLDKLTRQANAATALINEALDQGEMSEY